MTTKWTAFEIGNEDGSWSKWSICSGGPICYGGDTGNGQKASKQNAMLLASAPDLLRACKQALAALDAPDSCAADAHDWQEIRGELVNAINKAENKGYE